MARPPVTARFAAIAMATVRGRLTRRVRRGADQRAARPDRGAGRQDGGMARQCPACLSAAHESRRRADCRRLSGRNQHTEGPARARRAVRRRGEQGYGQPGSGGRSRPAGKAGTSARSLAGEPIVRLILDGTVARVRLERTFIASGKRSLKKATTICLLVVPGVRADGQKVLRP